ncbi:hypothetical protein KAX22_03940, partial [bacterium]|nr:hypothetical protein [bacterium]
GSVLSFHPGSRIDDTLATTIEAQYLDTGAVGNPAVSYYYLVFAANDLTQSPSSNRVGEFDKNMINGPPLGLRKPLSTKDH